MTLTARTNSDMIRSLCIREDYYTCGTNAEYSNLLGYVDEHQVLTEEALDWIAQDILDHSSHYDETKSNIIFKILNGSSYINME